MKILFVSLPVTKSDVDVSRFSSVWKLVLSSSDLFENVVYTSPNWKDILHDLEFPDRPFMNPSFLNEKEKSTSILEHFSEECFFFGEEWSFLSPSLVKRGILSMVDTTDPDIFFFYHIATENDFRNVYESKDCILCTMLWPEEGMGTFTIRIPNQEEGRVHKKAVSHKRILPTLLYLSNSKLVDDPDELLFSSKNGGVCLQVCKDPFQSCVFFTDENDRVVESIISFGSSDVISNMNPHIRFLKDCEDTKNRTFRYILEREKATIIRVNRQQGDSSTQTNSLPTVMEEILSSKKNSSLCFKDKKIDRFQKHNFDCLDQRRGTCFLFQDGSVLLSNNTYFPQQLMTVPCVTDQNGDVLFVTRTRNDSILIGTVRVLLFTFVPLPSGCVFYRCVHKHVS